MGKGPGYFVARVTNQKRLDDEKFQQSAWDVNRLLENRKRSCKIKYIRHDDKRVKKLRVSWTLQQQKKFRPKGFRKKVPRVADHHHDVPPAPNPEDPGYSTTYVGHGSQEDADGTTGRPQTGHSDPSISFQSHNHALYTATTSGPHVEDVIDVRTPEQITSDAYSLRESAGKPLTVMEKHYDFYNPAVGEIDLMMNRDLSLTHPSQLVVLPIGNSASKSS